MKKLLQRNLFLMAILWVSLPAMGQNTSIGIKGGPLWASISDTDEEGQALGFRAGAFLTYSIVREFGVGIEVNYARKGQKVDGASDNLQLNYLEIPLFGQYFLITEGPFRPKILAGGYYGHLLKAKQGDQEFERFNEQDYGFLAGIGFHQRLGNRQWLYVDVRYTHGLAEILDGSNQGNRDISLNFGISFPLESN